MDSPSLSVRLLLLLMHDVHCIFIGPSVGLCNAGGTIVHVLNDIVSRGGNVNNMIVVCVVACPPALKQLSEKFVGKLKCKVTCPDWRCTDSKFVCVQG